MNNLPFVQILIPVFNAGDDLLTLVSSIINNTESPIEVIVLDDGSAEFTLRCESQLRKMDPRVRLINNKDNVGYTRSINVGLLSCTAEFVIIMNSDTIVSRNWLSKLIAPVLSEGKVAAVGPLSNAASWQSVPLIKDSNNVWTVNQIPRGMSFEDYAYHVERLSLREWPAVPILNGFCTLFRRDVIEALGGFDDQSFPLGYGEENDLCLRITSAGYKLVIADDCYIYHNKSRSFGIERRSVLTKASNEVLRAKYPHVNFIRLEEELKSISAINYLRSRLLYLEL